jgi:RNA polymerase sigma-70 factor (ECF subfamily)
VSDANDKGRWILAAVDRYERPLTLYAARFVGDAERARDVVQDAFLKMWQADREQIAGHLAQWLYTVCRNRALDEVRKDGRMTALDHSKAPPGEAKPAAGTEPSAAEQSGQVLELLGTLPPNQQEVVRLKFQGGLSYKQIAEVMDLTVSHVGVLIHTAVKSIRQQMERRGATLAAAPQTGAPQTLRGEHDAR